MTAAGAPRTGLERWLLHSPRGPFRWTAFVLAVTSLAAAMPTPLYPMYEHRFQFSSGVLALIFAAYTPGVLLTLLIVAPQAERFGRRRLLFLGMVLTALGAGLFLGAQGLLWLALGRFVSGLAVGATTSVAAATMSDLEPYRDQHHVARVAVAANFGGFAVGVTVSGLLAQFAPDPSQLVYLLPIGASLLGLLAVRVLPETAPELGQPLPHRIQRISVPGPVRQPFWVAVGGLAACYAIYGLFAALAPSTIRTGFHLASPLAAASVVALMFGMVAVTQLATAHIRDRRALLAGFPLMILALAGLVAVLVLVSWGLLLVVTAVLGVAVGLAFMGSTTLVERVAPEEARGEILAGFYCAGYLALAVPTIGVAEVSEQVGLTAAGGLFAALLALVVVLLFAGTYRTPTPPGGGGRPRGAAAATPATAPPPP